MDLFMYEIVEVQYRSRGYYEHSHIHIIYEESFYMICKGDRWIYSLAKNRCVTSAEKIEGIFNILIRN